MIPEGLHIRHDGMDTLATLIGTTWDSIIFE